MSTTKYLTLIQQSAIPTPINSTLRHQTHLSLLLAKKDPIFVAIQYSGHIYLPCLSITTSRIGRHAEIVKTYFNKRQHDNTVYRINGARSEPPLSQYRRDSRQKLYRVNISRLKYDPQMVLLRIQYVHR